MSNVNLTKEGIEVKPGQVWRDLDERLGGRQCCVETVFNDGGNAVAVMRRIDRKPGAREVKTKVRLNRMHKGSQGWALVTEAA